MKTKTLIVGSVLVAVGVGAYFFLIKNKNAGAGLIPNELASVGTGATTSGAESQTEAPPTSSLDELATLTNDLKEQQKLLQAETIKTKFLSNLDSGCPPKLAGWNGDVKYNSCVALNRAVAIKKINEAISPLGYKLGKYNVIEKLVL